MKQNRSTAVLLLTGGAAVAVGFMAWRSIAAQPAILPLAERKQKLAHTEAVFLKKFTNVWAAQLTAALMQQTRRKMSYFTCIMCLYELVGCGNYIMITYLMLSS